MINNETMRYFFIILLLMTGACCSVKDSEIGKPENYFSTEREISEDCTGYQIKYYSGKNIFRFSLSGACKNLTMESFLQEYTYYLSTYRDSLADKRGFIIVDYYSISNENNVLVDSIIGITKRNFETYVALSEIDDNGFTIKVFDRK